MLLERCRTGRNLMTWTLRRCALWILTLLPVASVAFAAKSALSVGKVAAGTLDRKLMEAPRTSKN